MEKWDLLATTFSHLPIHFSVQCNLVFTISGQLTFSYPGKQWKPTYQVYCMHFHWESLQHDPFDPFLKLILKILMTLHPPNSSTSLYVLRCMLLFRVCHLSSLLTSTLNVLIHKATSEACIFVLSFSLIYLTIHQTSVPRCHIHTSN